MFTRIIFIIFIRINLSCCSSNYTEDYFNCSRIDRSRKFRGFILSGHGLDERYHSAKNILLNLGFNVSRYEPPGMEDPRWQELYNRITGGYTAGGVGTYQGRSSQRKKAFLLSQAWVEMVESAFPFSLRHNNRLSKTWLNDYTFFFEDDIGLHPEAQDPYCAIVTGIEINPPSGVLYLGIINPKCYEHTVINGFTYSKGCTGNGLHAVGLRNSMAAPFIAAIRVLQGTVNTDETFTRYSKAFIQSFWLVGSNLVEEPFTGIFFQDRKKLPSAKENNGSKI